MIGLGIDAGASSARWLLLGPQGRLAGGATGPITGHLYTEGERRATFAALDGLLDEVLLAGRPDAVVAGVTGLHGGAPEAELLAGRIAARLGLAVDAVLADDDMRVAYLAVLTPGEGVLVYAGTGSVAYHYRPDGAALRAGGYGYLIDDAGAGFWIGRQALCWLMRRRDALGRTPDGPLADALHRALGASAWDGIRAAVYGGGRRGVASLTPAVAAASERGDEAARAILDEAGRELAALAATLLTRLGDPLPVVFSGGVSRVDRVAESLARALPAGVTLRRQESEPVEAAARLALTRARGGGAR